MLRFGDIGAGIQGEDAVGRLLIIGGDDLDRAAGAPRGDQARDVDEADLRASGCDGADRIRRALRGHDGDVQAFLFEIAFAECDVPRRVAPEADEIKHEFEVALLRLRGRGLQARGDGGGGQHACDQRLRHPSLPHL